MKTQWISLVLGLLAQSTIASTVTIDFEDGVPPVNNSGIFTHFAVDDYYYSRYGLTFSGASFQNPSSGEFERFGSFSIFSVGGLAPTSISIFFEKPVSRVSIDQYWSVSNLTTSLVAFKPVLSSTPFPRVVWEEVSSDSFSVVNPSGCCGPQEFTLTVTAAGIQRVDITPSNLVFGTSGFNGIFDNLSFSPVPVPPAVGMLAAAFCALGAFVRCELAGFGNPDKKA